MSLPKVQFQSGELLQALEGRAEPPGVSISDIAKRDLIRYYDLLAWNMPELSAGEASLLVDILNGSIINHTTVALLWAQVSDAMVDGQGVYEEKWGVYAEPFVAWLRHLTSFECLAICDAVERFWGGAYRREEPMLDKLRAVGLVREKKEDLL